MLNVAAKTAALTPERGRPGGLADVVDVIAARYLFSLPWVSIPEVAKLSRGGLANEPGNELANGLTHELVNEPTHELTGDETPLSKEKA
ncbi:hypothetical protein GCM10010349_21140 [Streptomyces flavofungini]|nr:hypothetical protein GCM10010349_21140 [Streptomyces flavofungini]